MTLRPATDRDARLFFNWREAAELGNPAYQGERTTFGSHFVWFQKQLADRRAHLFVWMEGRVAFGCGRIDSNGEVTAYTTPERLPRLLAELEPYAREYGGRLKITLDADDPTLIDRPGWAEYPVRFYCYRP